MTELVKRLFGKKSTRFLFVGGLNTCVGYGTYALIIFLGWGYFSAQTISTVAGVTNSYFWNKYFTFKQPDKSFREILRFISVYGVSCLLNLGLLYLLISVFGVNEYFAGLIGIVFNAVINYFGHNFFSFKKKRGQKQNNGNTL